MANTLIKPQFIDENWTDEDWERYAAKMCEVENQYGFKASSWSVRPSRTYGDPLTDVMSPHPYPGATMLIYESGPLWGEPSGLFTAWVKGPRWLDLWTAGEEILARCGDKTNIFIEGFARLPGNPNTLEMQNGS